MPTLYAIAQEIAAAWERHTDKETGEVDLVELQPELDALEIPLEQKAIACAAYIRGREKDVDAFREQARFATEEARKAEAHIEWLKHTYMAEHIPDSLPGLHVTSVSMISFCSRPRSRRRGSSSSTR